MRVYNTPLFKRWVGMRSRCLNKNSHRYSRYGGRGIKICKRWDTFENFAADMGESFEAHVKAHGRQNTLIDRINNDGDYEPKNCRWVTRALSALNTSLVNLYKGESARAASIRLGGCPSLVQQRLMNGRSIEDAFTTPVKRTKLDVPESVIRNRLKQRRYNARNREKSNAYKAQWRKVRRASIKSTETDNHETV